MEPEASDRPAAPGKSWARLAAWVGSLVIGGAFIYAGILKLSDPSQFLIDIRSFALLPDPFAAWLALTLPWYELFAGVAVLTGIARFGGLLALNTLLVVFLAVILLSWMRGLDLSCGCFGGKAETADYAGLIIRDILLLLAGVVAWKGWTTLSAPPLSPTKA